MGFLNRPPSVGAVVIRCVSVASTVSETRSTDPGGTKLVVRPRLSAALLARLMQEVASRLACQPHRTRPSAATANP